MATKSRAWVPNRRQPVDSHPALGVALSGGGAQGLAQLGLLQTLDAAGLPIRYVAGTSSGAVVGAVYGTSGDAGEAVRRVVRHLRTVGAGFDVSSIASLESSAAPGHRGRLRTARDWWRLSRSRNALVGGARMRSSLHALLGQASFADTRIPFATTALDLVTGQCVVLRAGSLAEAAYASSAIPGLFEPLAVGGQILVDGAWAEPMPVAACRQLGARLVVAAPISGPGGAPGPGGAVATALRADALARRLLEESQLRAADLVARVEVDAIHFADFSRPERLIAAGARAAERVIPQLDALLRLGGECDRDRRAKPEPLHAA